MLGLALLLFGFYVARRGATTQIAVVMFLVAALIPLGAFGALFFGMIGAFDDVVRQGPNVTPADMSSGIATSLGYGGMALLGCVLGLVGAFRALMAARAATAERGDRPLPHSA